MQTSSEVPGQKRGAYTRSLNCKYIDLNATSILLDHTRRQGSPRRSIWSF